MAQRNPMHITGEPGWGRTAPGGSALVTNAVTGEQSFVSLQTDQPPLYHLDQEPAKSGEVVHIPTSGSFRDQLKDLLPDTTGA